jgi:hypothetical protein
MLYVVFLCFSMDQDTSMNISIKLCRKGHNILFTRLWKVDGALQRLKAIIKNS